MKAMPSVFLAVLQFVLVSPCAAAAPVAATGAAAARCCADPDDELVGWRYEADGDAVWYIETWKRADGSTYELKWPVG
jgi:hypothetical protein